MLVPIGDITVKKRIRKENSGIEELADSMRTYGLLNPIVIDGDYVLIAGFRRFQAAKKLGWKNIPASIVQAEGKIKHMELELEENVRRCDFTEQELLDGYAALEKLKNPGFLRKMFEKIKAFFIRICDTQEQQSEQKRRKNALLSLSAPLAVILAIASSVLHKHGYLNSVFLFFLNLALCVLLLYGVFAFIRFSFSRKKNRLSASSPTDESSTLPGTIGIDTDKNL